MKSFHEYPIIVGKKSEKWKQSSAHIGTINALQDTSLLAAFLSCCYSAFFLPASFFPSLLSFLPSFVLILMNEYFICNTLFYLKKMVILPLFSEIIFVKLTFKKKTLITYMRLSHGLKTQACIPNICPQISDIIGYIYSYRISDQ